MSLKPNDPFEVPALLRADAERMQAQIGALMSQRSTLSVLAAVAVSEYIDDQRKSLEAAERADPLLRHHYVHPRRATFEELILEAAQLCPYSIIFRDAADWVRSHPAPPAT